MHTEMAPPLVGECSDHNPFVPDHNLLNRMHTQMAPPLVGKVNGQNRLNF